MNSSASMRRPRFLVVWVLIASALILPPLGRAASAETVSYDQNHPIMHLIAGSASSRFDAIKGLVFDPTEIATEELQDLSKRSPIRQFLAVSKLGRAGFDFVQLKRAGEALPPADSAAGSPANSRPNVLLISIDTLRADHLGAYGYGRPTSPKLDALASEGAVFTNAFAPSSWTLPTHMSIFTSLYPSFHKLEKGGKVGSTKLGSETTLAQVLGKAKFATSAFVAHPFLAAQWGFHRGFDIYEKTSNRADKQVDLALLWLEWQHFLESRGLATDGFFLFLHVLDPHEPYDAPAVHQARFVEDYEGELKPSDRLVTRFTKEEFASPDDAAYVRALYDSEIHFVDRQLGRLFTRLAELGLEKDTIVIVTSDHGEEFKDHGSMGHKETLYDEQLRVPLILRYPAAIAANQRVASAASSIDIMPTVLDFLGLERPERSQGHSLRSALARPGSPPTTPVSRGDRVLFAELGPGKGPWERPFRRRAVRDGRYKLIVSQERDGRVRKEFFDTDSDPGETTNMFVAREGAPELEKLEEVLDAFRVEGQAYRPGAAARNAIEIDEKTQERLRSLGYMK